MIKEMMLDNFAHNDLSKYKTSHSYVPSYEISLSNEQSMDGTFSLKLAYHFGGWVQGNGPMPIIFKDPLTTYKRPHKFSLWVYGDRKSPWLRAVFVDGNNERKTVNLTSENVNWHGWKYIDVEIDSSWALPLTLEQIYSVETNKELQGDASYQGELYFDQLRFVFIDDEDFSGPEFKETVPEKDVVYQDHFTFRTRIIDEDSGVHAESIVMKVNDQEVDFSYCEQTNELTYDLQQLTHGLVHIYVEAKDNAGNLSVPWIDRSLQVDLTPDIEPPVITQVTPTETAVEYTDTPRITFHLVDQKSGVEAKDIVVKINEVEQPVFYDEKIGWGYAVSEQSLKEGEHELFIQAQDRSGNLMDPLERTFTVQPLPPPKGERFSISILPDTHRYNYGKLGIERALAQETDFIIHMGDLVDQATEEEYKDVEKLFPLLKDKVMLTTPGNHESFQGHLDKYMRYFGAPTYHLTYGNTLFIFLNSAFGESLLASDATQLHYLEKTLQANQRKNVIIVTHVPTKDDFGTAHEMAPADAKLFKNILSAYKKEHAEVNITVLFGHLHVLQEWEVDGVKYIITGNGAAKGYVANEYGNVFGKGLLHVSSSEITYEFIPYVKELAVHVKADPIEELTLRRGEHIDLQVYGSIDELHTKYTIDLTNFDPIKKSWSSSNEQIVVVNCDGKVWALQTGEAELTVEMAGKSATLPIRVTEARQPSS